MGQREGRQHLQRWPDATLRSLLWLARYAARISVTLLLRWVSPVRPVPQEIRPCPQRLQNTPTVLNMLAAKSRLSSGPWHLFQECTCRVSGLPSCRKTAHSWTRHLLCERGSRVAAIWRWTCCVRSPATRLRLSMTRDSCATRRRVSKPCQ